METFKRVFICGVAYLVLMLSCNHQKDSGNDAQEISISFENPYLSKNLRDISHTFINNFNLDNSIIEVTIDRKSPEEIYIILKCRGSAYFKAMKLKPTFTYEMNNNSFFVFTGAEMLFDSTFDEKRFQDRRKGKCNESLKACYWFNNGKMVEDKACTFPYPFSDLKMSEPPLKKLK